MPVNNDLDTDQLFSDVLHTILLQLQATTAAVESTDEKVIMLAFHDLAIGIEAMSAYIANRIVDAAFAAGVTSLDEVVDDMLVSDRTDYAKLMIKTRQFIEQSDLWNRVDRAL